ncbi:hypothetical protein CEXT_495611 [Caerostris extrusa]|uniref:Uncharacterized protein n=1 Tax=Caerostris extrusa TaxID=172846 RepID=A0AAV4TG71_CAEEX|nr:hypothetical protein CEXT_495611 [Caerostris extrusa]
MLYPGEWVLCRVGCVSTEYGFEHIARPCSSLKATIYDDLKPITSYPTNVFGTMEAQDDTLMCAPTSEVNVYQLMKAKRGSWEFYFFTHSDPTFVYRKLTLEPSGSSLSCLVNSQIGYLHDVPVRCYKKIHLGLELMLVA